MSLEEEIKKLVYDAVKDAAKEVFEKHLKDLEERSASEHRVLYSLRELADFLGCSTVTAQRLKNEGKIPYWQIGRKIMFDSDKVLKAMEHTWKKPYPGKKTLR